VSWLADEGIDRIVVERLREAGYPVVWVADQCPGATDEHVLALAHQLDAVLIPADKDFGELVFRQGRANAGVLLARLSELLPTDRARRVQETLDSHAAELRGHFSVLSPQSLRIRTPTQ
jgi:predicted nuclease of predicted toxin-antitoxin system